MEKEIKKNKNWFDLYFSIFALIVALITLFCSLKSDAHHKTDRHYKPIKANCKLFQDSELRRLCRELKKIENKIEKQEVITEKCGVVNKDYYLFTPNNTDIDKIDSSSFQETYSKGIESCILESDRRLNRLEDDRRLVYKQYLVRIRDIEATNKENKKLYTLYNLKIDNHKKHCCSVVRKACCSDFKKNKKKRKTIKIRKGCSVTKKNTKFYGNINIVNCPKKNGWVEINP